MQVLSPLNSLLHLFQGPQRLIQKRNDKCLDYDRWSNKIDKIKDRDKLKAVSLCDRQFKDKVHICEQTGFESNSNALVLHCCATRLAEKPRAALSSNRK